MSNPVQKEVATPSVAVVLTLIFGPMVGHAYAGEWLRGGAIWLVFALVEAGLASCLARAGSSFRLVFLAMALLAVVVWIGAAVDVGRGQTRFRPLTSTQRMGGAAAGWLAVTVCSMLFSLGLRVFVIEAFKVPSGSMIPALLIGDHLFVDKLAKPGVRGDIIVFKYPENPAQDFVKRVVAVGGESVVVDEMGLPTINGVAATRCTLGEAPVPGGGRMRWYLETLGGKSYLVVLPVAEPGAASAEPFGPFVVPSGELFVLGDNRMNSHDSRSWHAGAGAGVPEGLVRGRASSIWLSPSSPEPFSREQAMSVPQLPPSASSLASALASCPR